MKFRINCSNGPSVARYKFSKRLHDYFFFSSILDDRACFLEEDEGVDGGLGVWGGVRRSGLSQQDNKKWNMEKLCVAAWFLGRTLGRTGGRKKPTSSPSKSSPPQKKTGCCRVCMATNFIKFLLGVQHRKLSAKRIKLRRKRRQIDGTLLRLRYNTDRNKKCFEEVIDLSRLSDINSLSSLASARAPPRGRPWGRGWPSLGIPA
jgi:hypothetical protein